MYDFMYLIKQLVVKHVAIAVCHGVSLRVRVVGLNANAVTSAIGCRLLTLPMSFFDTQPSGRLVNRFTKDVEACDISLCNTLGTFVTCMTSVLLSMVVIAAVTRGTILLALIPLLFLFLRIQSYFLATSRELKRLDSVARSPILTHFTETLAGLTTLRAFRRQGPCMRENEALLDASNRAWWPTQARSLPAWSNACALHCSAAQHCVSNRVFKGKSAP